MIRSISAIAKHGGHLEGFLAALNGQTTSSTPIINYCHGFKEGLKILTSLAPTNNYCHGLKEGLETLISSAPTNNHCYSLKKGLETLTSSALTNNYRYVFRESLKTQLMTTTFTSFISNSNISDIMPSSIKPAKTGYVLGYGHCWHSKIKDSILAAFRLCKYIWKVIMCIVVISKGY